MPQDGPRVTDPQGQSVTNLRGQAEAGRNPGFLNSFSSLLSWISQGASSLGRNSFFSMLRGVRDQGQVLAEHAEDDNPEEVFSDAQEQ